MTVSRPGFFALHTLHLHLRRQMLRSVVMSFVLSSVFFGLHVATLLVTFDLS
jgi:hypothetical protein